MKDSLGSLGIALIFYIIFFLANYKHLNKINQNWNLRPDPADQPEVLLREIMAKPGPEHSSGVASLAVPNVNVGVGVEQKQTNQRSQGIQEQEAFNGHDNDENRLTSSNPPVFTHRNEQGRYFLTEQSRIRNYSDGHSSSWTEEPVDQNLDDNE